MKKYNWKAKLFYWLFLRKNNPFIYNTYSDGTRDLTTYGKSLLEAYSIIRIIF